MKVRIKKTGEILEVAEYAKVAMDVCDSYGNPLVYGLDEIEIIGERHIFESHSVVDWQQVKIQAAIGAMQAQLLLLVVMEIRCITKKHQVLLTHNIGVK